MAGWLKSIIVHWDSFTPLTQSSVSMVYAHNALKKSAGTLVLFFLRSYCLHYYLRFMSVPIIRGWNHHFAFTKPAVALCDFLTCGDISLLIHLRDMFWHKLNWAEVNCGFGNLLEWISEKLFTAEDAAERAAVHSICQSLETDELSNGVRARVLMTPSSWYQIKQVVAQQAFSSVNRHQSFHRYYIWLPPCIKHELCA